MSFKAEAQARKQLYRDIREVLSTPAGKRIAFWLIGLCKVFSSTFRRNSEAAYLEGRRSVGLELLQVIKSADPGLCVELLGMGFNREPEEKDLEYTVSAQEQIPDEKGD